MDQTPMQRESQETFTDTLEFEISQLKRILGIAYIPILKRMGIGKISTRNDMNQFAARLLDSGL